MSLIPFVILDVDARDKRGHDESNIARIGITGSRLAPSPAQPGWLGWNDIHVR